MPRTKGSKNRVKTDFDAQIAKLQKDKALLEEGVAKTVAQIEELKTDIKSTRESLKSQRAGDFCRRKPAEACEPSRGLWLASSCVLRRQRGANGERAGRGRN